MNQRELNSVFLGVDAGGSTLRAVLVSHCGTVLNRFEVSGNLNITSAGTTNIITTFQELSRQIPQPAGVNVAMAGAGHGKGRQELTAVLNQLYPKAKVVVRTDAEGALFANFPDSSGILVICGTGSVAFGKTSAGTVYRAGGWGFLLGDEASGFWIVKEVMRHYLHYCDGIFPYQSCFSVIQERFPENPREAIAAFYLPENRNDVAAASRCLMDASDPWLWSVIESGLETLACGIQTLARKLKDKSPSIAWMGGLFHNSEFFTRFHATVSSGIQAHLFEGTKDIALALAREICQLEKEIP
jgi:N-acetylglucosamine kinase-like BadF-type ATPase